jgi:hypothetical protein
MSLPHEEARALVAVRQFLYDLLDPKKTPRVPKAIRTRAYRVSKHYPLFPTADQVTEKMDTSCTQMYIELLERLKKDDR